MTLEDFAIKYFPGMYDPRIPDYAQCSGWKTLKQIQQDGIVTDERLRSFHPNVRDYIKQNVQKIKQTMVKNYLGQKRLIRQSGLDGQIIAAVYEAKHQTGLSQATPSDPDDSIITFVLSGRPRPGIQRVVQIPASLIEELTERIEVFTGFETEAGEPV